MAKAERPEDQPIVDEYFTSTEGPAEPPEERDAWKRGKRNLAREIKRKSRNS